MAQLTQKDTWTNIRVRVSRLGEINDFIKSNPVFENPTKVVDFALAELFKRSAKK